MRAFCRPLPSPMWAWDENGRQGRIAGRALRRGLAIRSDAPSLMRPHKRPRLPFSANRLFFPAKRPRQARRFPARSGVSTWDKRWETSAFRHPARAISRACADSVAEGTSAIHRHR